MPRETAAGGVVSRDGKLLLVRVTNLSGEKVWTFPKGHCEKGEKAQQTALREVEEETGWRCSVRRPLMKARYFFLRQGRPVHKTVDWFWMKADKKTGRPDAGEILSSRWVDTKRAIKLLSYPSDFKLIDSWRAVEEKYGQD
jgi:ADP-ribose pyrophosphatase YjhB (NUDIX family)